MDIFQNRALKTAVTILLFISTFMLLVYLGDQKKTEIQIFITEGSKARALACDFTCSAFDTLKYGDKKEVFKVVKVNVRTGEDLSVSPRCFVTERF